MAATLSLSAPSQFVSADSTTIDFEGFSTGTVNAQDGWSSTGAAGSGCAVYDHKIDDNTYGYASFGVKSLRMSNAVTSGCFNDHTFSKSLVDEAGEASAVNNGLSGGTRQPYFEAQWDFASTVPETVQSGLSVVASPDRGDGARMSWVQMRDESGGLAIAFNDYISSTGPITGFIQTTIASGLDRTKVHTIKITMQFVDGPGNDVVKVYVNGNLMHIGTSWEDYFRIVEGNPTRPVDSILFRTGGTAAPATAGKGFLIDNLTLYSGPVPVPPPPPCTNTCYVDAVNGSDSNTGASPSTAKKTIQAAIDQVSVGGSVIAAAGTYLENLAVNKRLTLDGAGSGSNPAVDTIVQAPAANVPVATLNTGGSDATNRLVIKDVRLTGGNGSTGINASSGVLADQNVSYLTFDNVAAVNNAGHGIAFNAASGVVNDVQILNSDISSNTGSGIRFGTFPYVNGLSVKNSEVNSNGVIGLSLNPAIANGNTSTDVIIDAVTFNGNGTTSFAQNTLGYGDISLLGFNGNATLKDVVVNGLASNGAHVGIQLRGSNTPAPMGNVSFNNVQVTGSWRRPSLTPSSPGGQGHAIAIQNYGAGGSLSMTGVNVNVSDGNALFLSGLTSPINIGNASLSAPNANAFHLFIGASGQNNVPTNVDATGATFGGVPANTATLAQLYTIEDKVFHGVDAGGILLGFVRVKAGNVYVTPNSFAAPGFPTPSIQRGVDVASAGDTVNVQAGTYTEQVVAAKSLALVGTDGAANTFIKAPATLPIASNPDSTIVKIAGAGVNVELTGFTITGPGPGSCGTILAGIFVRDGANANIHDNRVLDIRDDEPSGDAPFSGCQNGVGIIVGRQQVNTIGNATIKNNEISGYQKNGIVVSNVGSSALIEGNTVAGFGAQGTIAQNGVQVSAGAVATVQNNTIKDHLCNYVSNAPNPSCGPDLISDVQSAGVLLFGAGTGTVVKGNNIQANDMGVYAYGGQLEVKENTITANRYAGVFVDESKTTVAANEVTGASNLGVIVASFDGAAVNSEAILNNNLIKDAVEGIKLVDTGASDTALPVLTANLNSIAGSTSGLNNTSSNPVNAEKNWWGSSTGPTNAGNPSGTGAVVAGNVDFIPWLCDGTDTSAAIGFQPNMTQCGPATQLMFTTQPSNGVAGVPLPTQPVVKAYDDYGNVVTGFTGAVSLAFGNNPSGATLTASPVNAVAGVATFSGVSVNLPGNGYTLVASSPDLTSATSNAFNIVYACTAGPIQQPINADGSSKFKINSTIPVKIRVLCNGVPANNLTIYVTLQKVGAGGGDVNEVVSTSAADTGNIMRSTGDGNYMFNLSTKRSQFAAGSDLTAGTYLLTLASNSNAFANVSVTFNLRK